LRGGACIGRAVERAPTQIFEGSSPAVYQVWYRARGEAPL
jgi:hypothetical protein